MMTLLTMAAERSDVRPAKVTPLIAALPGIPICHELLLSNATVPTAYLSEIVDNIVLPLVATADGRACTGGRGSGDG